MSSNMSATGQHEELGTVGEGETKEGSSMLMMLLMLFVFYQYGPSNSILGWIGLLLFVILANLYMNQERMLYVPQPPGFPRKLAHNPPSFRSPAEVS